MIVSMIIKFALAMSPFFLKYALFLLDKFISDDTTKKEAQKKAIEAAHDYNAHSSDIYSARTEFIGTMEKYLAVLKAEQDKIPAPIPEGEKK